MCKLGNGGYQTVTCEAGTEAGHRLPLRRERLQTRRGSVLPVEDRGARARTVAVAPPPAIGAATRRSRSRSTPTCSTPTRRSPRSSTSARGSLPGSSPPPGCCRSAVGSVRPLALVRRRRGGPRAADPRRPGRARDPGRRAHRRRAVGAGRPAAAARPGHGSTCVDAYDARGACCARPGSRCSTATSPSASGRGRRSPASLPGARAGARSNSTCCGRSPASRGSRFAWSCSCGT